MRLKSPASFWNLACTVPPDGIAGNGHDRGTTAGIDAAALAVFTWFGPADILLDQIVGNDNRRVRDTDAATFPRTAAACDGETIDDNSRRVANGNDLIQTAGGAWGRALTCQCLAESYLLIGELAQAEQHAQRVIHEEETDTLPDRLRVLREIRVARREFEEGTRYLQEAIRIAIESQDPYLEAYAWRTFMVMLRRQRKLDNAHKLREKTVALFSEIELPRKAQKTEQLFTQIVEEMDGLR